MAKRKTKTKKVPVQHPDYVELVGRACRTKDDDGNVVEGVVSDLGEWDKNGTPKTCMFRVRNSSAIMNPNPKDVEVIEGGF